MNAISLTIQKNKKTTKEVDEGQSKCLVKLHIELHLLLKFRTSLVTSKALKSVKTHMIHVCVWSLECKCNKGIPKTPNYSWFLSQSKSQDGKAYQPYCITEKWKNSNLLKQLPQPKYQASPEWNIMTHNTIFSSTIKWIKKKKNYTRVCRCLWKFRQKFK